MHPYFKIIVVNHLWIRIILTQIHANLTQIHADFVFLKDS